MGDGASIGVGSPAPDFTAESTQGRIRLSNYKGKSVVLYFYVKDMTPGCTVQSIGIKDSMERIRALGAEVIGISSDDLESHKRFAAKYGLNFPLVSDADNSISKAYGVFNEEKGRARRVTFIIDRDGVIRHIMNRVDVKSHADDVIDMLKKLQ
ncbi:MULTISPECIES: peroxiredoxin [Candidatus Nitrosocaldus]|jgi:peroxiredoxin Q/BCP|uniref:thioredoxin-dependent peroxiredoxin n=1 Tax=Candidatus Nitrosocaldus cavascurensis TaxID=2058097 RepID=A0A2K5ASM0_9ARCH|nr:MULTISPECIES: peroxiredoxin [Candidatus Nitrosocaldus]SPC34645.1 putative peroxiredoxin bcp [Candidatus Nitrosocaldus cavascurensis]